LLLCITFSANALAQPKTEIGVRVAMPVRGPIETSGTITLAPGYDIFSSTPRHISIGASASIPIFQRLRLRLEPAYQRIGITTDAFIKSDFGENRIKQGIAANNWRLPVLLETGLARHVRFGIGPALSLVTGGRATFEQRSPFFNVNQTIAKPPDKRALFGVGAALEFPFRLGPVILAPEIRYNRWTGKHYGGIWAMDEATAGLAIRLPAFR
jgi:hypothetical protein